MADGQEAEPAIGWRWRRWLAIAAIALVIYLLAIGPAYALSSMGIISYRTFEILYRPVFLIGSVTGDPFGLVQAYIRWWLRITGSPIY